jgi:membrane protease YdiL (CAAX protease family)
VSSPDNLLPEVHAGLPVEPALTPAPVINPGAENPPWTGFDLLLAAFVFLMVLFVSSTFLLVVAMHGPRPVGISAAELEKNPSPQVVVPAMTLGYVSLLATMYWLVTRYRHRRFWQAVAWHWPRGNWWLVCLVGGGMLALGLGLLSRLLPIPKSLPMDRLFRDRQGAYLMMFLGVGVAPLAEEMLFRGFLYPALDRWLQTLFMVRQQLHAASRWVLLLAGWGYLEHRLSSAGALALAAVACLTVGVLFLVRSLRTGGKPAHRVLLLGIGFLVWGVVSRSVSDRDFVLTTFVLLAIAVLLGLTGAAGAIAPSPAGRLGRLLAVLVTSLGFALVHGEQLGRAWGPLLVIFTVGLVLTITRVVTRSVAPGFLVHVGYNLTLFGVLYAGTDHFRHLERMTQ